MANIQDSPYQNLVFKTSHNSYDRKEDIEQQLSFDSSHTYQCGCRGVELDIWRHSSDSMNKGYFTVNHLTNGGENLSEYLDELSDWHGDNPNHDVVWVMLDIKSSDGDKNKFPDEIDSYLTSYFGRSLIKTPHDLFPGLTDSNKLSDVLAAQGGWPSLSSLKNHFIFCLSGNEDWKKVYYHNNSTRICFADCSDIDKLTVSNSRVVYNVESGHGKQSDFNTLMEKKMLIRVYNVNSEDDWNAAIGMGANLLATDKVSDNEWAAVSSTGLFAQRSRIS